MSSLDTCGSEWRRWDLHLHIPGTHLSDGYREPENSAETIEEQFCRRLHESDVNAFGITDYFDATNVIRIINMYRDRYKDSPKLLLPNIEFRLTDVVNKDDQFVNFHLLFSPDVPGDKIIDCVRRIPVEVTEESGRRRECGELQPADFARATVSRGRLIEHLREFFGDRAPRDANLLTLVPAGNDGIRAQQGSPRRTQVAREIEADSDAILGNVGDRDWYLRPDRYGEASERSHPRPVFKGSDAHSFAQLDSSYSAANIDSYSTWIKADLTYEGLRQTLLEPQERVKIGGGRPDQKSPFKWLRRVTFSGPNFPEEIQLSENLNSIIGSRSSGKSALLAHVAYAVSPEETVRTMQGASLFGPAAGITWEQALAEGCEVEWAAPETREGRVIYIPQNALYALSERPQEITSRIRPLIEKRFEAHAALLLEYERSLAAARDTVKREVGNWLTAYAAANEARKKAQDVGDEAGIRATMLQLDEIIQQRVVDIDEARIEFYTSSLSTIDVTRQSASRSAESEAARATFNVNISVSPSIYDAPDELGVQLVAAIDGARESLSLKIQELQRGFLAQQNDVVIQTEKDEASLREAHSDVVDALAANAAAADALRRRRELERRLSRIKEYKAQQEIHEARCLAASGRIDAALAFAEDNLVRVKQYFSGEKPVVDGMSIHVEADYTEEAALLRAQGINKTRDSRFVSRGEGVILREAQSAVDAFLRSLAEGETSLNAGAVPDSVAVTILAIRPELRLVAELDGDRIGGFENSSMTPGKQALFALTLLLGEDGDGWPLLLDQPEDDLDSRSIYDQLVPYLLKRKRERQIILVSHNANLVVGADSECVIVSNRHGSDRPNHRSRTFDYRTGSLENSFSKPAARTTLSRQGVREHVCQLLDGGPEAFQRRSRKYRLHSL